MLKEKIHQNNINAVLLMAILFLAFGLRYYGIERQGLWSDELLAVCLGLLKPHFHDIFPQLLSDSHPPGYVSFMYFYTSWFRHSELEIRLPSLIAGVVLVYFVYMFAKRYLSASVGLIAAMLVAVSFQSIYYSQEARAYAMLSLACFASFYYFLPLILHQTINKKDYVGFVVSTTPALYLHYAGFVFFACEGLILLFVLLMNENRIDFAKQGIKFFLPPLLLYAPWLTVMFKQMTGIQNYWGGALKPDINTLVQLARFLLGPDMRLVYAYCAVWGICVVAALGFIIFHIKDSRIAEKPKVLLALAFMAIAPIAVFYIKSQFSQAVFQNRHFVPSIAFFALIAGEIIFFLPEKIHHVLLRNIILLSILAVISVTLIERNNFYLLYEENTKDPWRESVEVIQADKEFMSRKNPLVMRTHGAVAYYIEKAGMSVYPDDVYAPNHYDELRNILMKEGEFYFITINPAEQYGFFTRVFEDFQPACWRKVSNWAGTLNVVKFKLKENAVGNALAPECAPDLQFNFITPNQYN